MRKACPAILGLICLLLVGASFTRGPLTTWLVSVLVILFPALLVVIALPAERLQGLRGLLISAMLSVGAGILGVTALHGSVATGPWIGGIPLGLALLLGLVWLLPFPLMVTAYARSLATPPHGAETEGRET